MLKVMKSMYKIGNMKLGGSTINNNQFLAYYLQYEELREIIYNDLIKNIVYCIVK